MKHAVNLTLTLSVNIIAERLRSATSAKALPPQNAIASAAWHDYINDVLNSNRHGRRFQASSVPWSLYQPRCWQHGHGINGPVCLRRLGLLSCSVFQTS